MQFQDCNVVMLSKLCGIRTVMLELCNFRTVLLFELCGFRTVMLMFGHWRMASGSPIL